MNAPSDAPWSTRQAYVVDDDEPFRRSLLVLLESAGWKVRGFSSGRDFTEVSGALEPGILLLDLNLGEGTGLDLIERERDALDRFAIVMMTGAGEIATAVRSIKAGAADFIEKPFFSEELLGRLAAVEKDFAATLRSKATVWEAQGRVSALSPRERDVFEGLLGGASNKLIARDLEISPRTVEMHRARMVAKLGVATTAEALELGRLAGVRSGKEPVEGGRSGGTAE